MKAFLYLSILTLLTFISQVSYGQDIIIQKNGEEIEVKVLEVKQDEITYKNWLNLEGPTYTKDKSDIFMIKYANGSKDVFESNSNQNNSSTKINPPNTTNFFVGTWYHKKYDGYNNKTTLFISKALDNFLVDYKVYERVDEYFHDANGSFKEIGHLENGSIVINSMTKLSLLNENTLLMNSEEFYCTKRDHTSQNSISNNPANTSTSSNLENPTSSYVERKSLETSHVGHFNNEVKDKSYITQYVSDTSTSILKNLFYKGQNISLNEASFGTIERYKDDKLIVKKGDTLKLDITCLKFKDGNKEWDGKQTEYLLSIQIEDEAGNEYHYENCEQIINIRKSNSPIVRIAKYDVDVPIRVEPNKLLSLPYKQDLYLSILLKAKTEKKTVWEGFLKFRIE
jgi:hypothetical protein